MSLARAKDQIIAKAYKIGSGNFADENEWLVKFANAGAEEHGRLYGKIIPELAIAAVTMGEGTAARAGGRVLSEGMAEVAAKGGGKYLYHYTSKEAAQSISQPGIKIGRDGFSYLTNKGNLSSLQAHIELALPANGALPNSILRIDASGLNPSLIRRVSGNLPGYGAGGGTEFLFNQHIPANLIKVIK